VRRSDSGDCDVLYVLGIAANHGGAKELDERAMSGLLGGWGEEYAGVSPIMGKALSQHQEYGHGICGIAYGRGRQTGVFFAVVHFNLGSPLTWSTGEAPKLRKSF